MKGVKLAAIIPFRPLPVLTLEKKREVLHLLNGTIQSLRNTQYSELEIVVAGSGGIESPGNDAGITIIDLHDYAPEVVEAVARDPSADHRLLDIRSKRLWGVRHALNHGAEKTILIDADDQISRRTLWHVADSGAETSWLAEMGWEYIHRLNRLYLRNSKFDARCGTCAVISRRDLLEKFRIEDKNSPVGDFYHHHYVEKITGHAERLPFPAFAYRTDHGSNFTLGFHRLLEERFLTRLDYLARYACKALVSRAVSPKWIEEFGDPREVFQDYIVMSGAQVAVTAETAGVH